jgi:hypothetical protein
MKSAYSAVLTGLYIKRLESVKGKGKGNPITGYEGPRGGVEV